jgi:hypothetical protein
MRRRSSVLILELMFYFVKDGYEQAGKLGGEARDHKE